MLAMLRKEWMEAVRTGRLLNLTILFVVFGIMSPAIAKLTPWLMEMMAAEMEASGLMVTEVQVDALTSWTQFFKNIPLGLLAFVLLHGSILTGELQKGTLTLIITKGLPRWKVMVSKIIAISISWTLGYWACYGITYGYTAYYWDNTIVGGLPEAAAYWWLFGLWVSLLLMLFSVITESNNGSLIITGAAVLAAYVLSLIPKIAPYSPMKLAGGMAFINAAAEVPAEALSVTILLTMTAIPASIVILNRK